MRSRAHCIKSFSANIFVMISARGVKVCELKGVMFLKGMVWDLQDLGDFLDLSLYKIPGKPSAIAAY